MYTLMCDNLHTKINAHGQIVTLNNFFNTLKNAILVSRNTGNSSTWPCEFFSQLHRMLKFISFGKYVMELKKYFKQSRLVRGPVSGCF